MQISMAQEESTATLFSFKPRFNPFLGSLKNDLTLSIKKINFLGTIPVTFSPVGNF